MDAASIIRRAREASGLSLRALGERAGTSYSTLSAYEHGRKSPRIDTLERIVRAAGASLGYTLDVSIERRNGVDRGEELSMVLDLAESLPRSEPSETLHAPRFGRSTGNRH
jgi:transcriptional regulator with XRE-family HTH domain